MSEVVEVNDIDELEHYWLVWNSLHRQTRRGSFFQSLDWLRMYWRHFGSGQRLRTLIVYSGGEAIGIVPLVVRREPTRVGPIRVLTYPLDDWGTFFGPVGPNPTATLTASLRYLRHKPRDWDLLDLRWIDRDGHDRGRTHQAMQMAGFPGHQRVWKAAAMVDTQGDWDQYFASRTSKFRNNARRAEKRVAQLGTVTYERFRPGGAAIGDDDPRWSLFDECVEVARRSWQGASPTGTTLSHASVSEYFRDVHAVAAKAGALDLNVIRLDGAVIAFGYNYVSQGLVAGQRVGILPPYARGGVASVLYLRMFQDSCDRNDQVFDLGPGSLAIKRPWLTRIAHSYHYTHYPRVAPRIQLLRMKHWMSDRFERKLKVAKTRAVR